MKYKYAWVTITGKVYVPVDEMESLLSERLPEKKEQAEKEGWPTMDLASPKEEQLAFDVLARQKIAEKYEVSDDPVKVTDVSIDLSTLQ